jgi:membrane associated rhomboid family serine protease
MQALQDHSKEKRQFINAVFIPAIIVLFMIITFFFEKGMELDFHSAGVYPRRFENIGGIFSMIFIHSSWSHLLNNVLSFFVLGSFLYYFYRQIAPKVLVISYIFSGLILWVIGRESWHIGASGLIYSLAFFLFFSGLIRKYVPLIAISLIVAFIYGSMVWHIFPWQLHDPISWEGHLAGGFTGTVLSVWLRNKEPQKPVELWPEDEDNDSLEYLQESDNDQQKENQIII